MPIDIDKTPSFTPSDAARICNPEQPVLSHGVDLDAHAQVEPHQHPRGQLLWAAEGVLRVTSEEAVWIVPPSHAVWIPSGILHQVVTETAARMRNLYIDSSVPVRDDTHSCAILLLTPLMREIILRLTEEARFSSVASHIRLGLVAIDEIQRLESAPLNLPAGQDARLRRLTGHMIRNPGEQRPLGELAKIAGGSLRTIERLYKNETGMTFRQWRSRLRLLCAIERLGQGENSTAIAYSLGFGSASSFVAAFRLQFGSPPQDFLQKRG